MKVTKRQLKSLIQEVIEESKLVEEASEINIDEVPAEKQEFLNKFELLDDTFGNELEDKDYSIYDGIHGLIFRSNTTQKPRFDKEDLQKLIDDPDFRWLDTSSIGF